MLSTFSPSLRVAAEEAKQDNIAVDLGDWYIQDIGNHIGAFFDLIATPPPTESIETWANLLTTVATGTFEREWFGWMFNRPAGNFDEHTELKVTGGGKKGPAKPATPLAKGKLKIIKIRPKGRVQSETQRRKIRLYLSLNPTRFLRHQDIPENVNEPYNQWPRTKLSLIAQALPKRRKVGDDGWNTEDETSLDGNDNVLIGNSQLSFGRPDVWNRQMQRYLATVERALNLEFIRAADGAISDFDKNKNSFDWARFYSLRKVETYFEFHHEKPVALVSSLEPILLAMGMEAKSRFYPNGLCNRETEERLPPQGIRKDEPSSQI